MSPRKIGYEDTDLMFLENVDDLLVFGSVFLHFGTSQGLLYREIPSRSWLSYWGQGQSYYKMLMNSDVATRDIGKFRKVVELVV